VAAVTGTQFGIDMTAGDIYTIAGNGAAGYFGDGGPAGSAKLYLPIGLAADTSGNLYIADSGNNRVREVAAGDGTQYGISMKAGNIYNVAGSATWGYSGDGGQATLAMLDSPIDVAVDSSGDLYFADLGNDRIREVIQAR
jgi:hypothetical protein